MSSGLTTGRMYLTLTHTLNLTLTQVSSGLTTGRMFCAYAGSELRAEYTLHGKVVNAAARMMSHAASKGSAPPLADAPRSGMAMTCRGHAPQARPS